MGLTQSSASNGGGKTTGRPVLSDARERQLMNCKKANRPVRENYGLAAVDYHRPLNEDEMAGLVLYVRDNMDASFDSVEAVLNDESIPEKASKVLCRWMRPEEKLRLALELTGDYKTEVTYSTGIMVFADGGAGAGRIVGPRGKNLVDLTREHGLLYAWMAGQGEKKAIILYGLDIDAIKGAMLDIYGRWSTAFRFNPNAAILMGRSLEKMDNFVMGTEKDFPAMVEDATDWVVFPLNEGYDASGAYGSSSTIDVIPGLDYHKDKDERIVFGFKGPNGVQPFERRRRNQVSVVSGGGGGEKTTNHRTSRQK